MFNPLQSEMTLCERTRASLSGSAVPYHSPTCGFAFRHAGTCFHVVYARHWHLKG